jgi:hypothetical protein
MKHDAWRQAYQDGMASERRSAAEALARAQSRLDHAMADRLAGPDVVFGCWVTLRTIDAMYQTILDLEGDHGQVASRQPSTVTFSDVIDRSMATRTDNIN